MAPTDGMEEEQKAAPKKPQPHNAGDIRSGQLKPASSVKKAQQRSAADPNMIIEGTVLKIPKLPDDKK